MSVPANKALSAHEEVKKDLVDILKMYMPANLNQIPAYMQPKRLYTVQSTVVHTKHNKALAAPKAVKVERCQRSRYTESHKGLAGGATLAQNSALLEASQGAKNKNTALSAPTPYEKGLFVSSHLRGCTAWPHVSRGGHAATCELDLLP